MNQKRIGELISKIRKEKNLTQEELGNKLNVSGKSVSKWERGINLPDISILTDLCRILDIKIEELLKGKLTEKQKLPFYKKIKSRKFIIASIFIILILSTMSLFIYKKNNQEKIFFLYSLDQKILFKGYIIFSNEKNMLLLNSFTPHSEFKDLYVRQYHFLIESGEKILLQISSDDVNIYESLYDIIENLNFEIVENKDSNQNIIEYKDLNNLYLIVEYIDKNENYEKFKIKIETE